MEDFIGSMIRDRFANTEYRIYPDSLHKVKGKKSFCLKKTVQTI